MIFFWGGAVLIFGELLDIIHFDGCNIYIVQLNDKERDTKREKKGQDEERSSDGSRNEDDMEKCLNEYIELMDRQTMQRRMKLQV